MNKEVQDALEVDLRFRILSYILSSRKVLSECREFGIPRSTFYRWKKAYEKKGKEGLFRKKPIAKSHPRQIPADYIEKILHLRTQYHLGPQRITSYRALSWIQDLLFQRLSHAKKKWHWPPSSKRRRPRSSHSPLRQAGSRAPDPDRRQVPGLGKGGWSKASSLSIHGYR